MTTIVGHTPSCSRNSRTNLTADNIDSIMRTYSASPSARASDTSRSALSIVADGADEAGAADEELDIAQMAQ